MSTEPYRPRSPLGLEEIAFASIPMGSLFQGAVLCGEEIVYRSLARHARRADAVASVKRAWQHVDAQLTARGIT